jgi:hypothetical protein
MVFLLQAVQLAGQELNTEVCARIARLWAIPEVQTIAKTYYDYEIQAAQGKSEDIRWRLQYDSAVMYITIHAPPSYDSCIGRMLPFIHTCIHVCNV